MPDRCSIIPEEQCFYNGMKPAWKGGDKSMQPWRSVGFAAQRCRVIGAGKNVDGFKNNERIHQTGHESDFSPAIVAAAAAMAVTQCQRSTKAPTATTLCCPPAMVATL